MAKQRKKIAVKTKDIQEWMDRRGVVQNELAKEIGITKRQMQNILAGGGTTMERVQRIGLAMGVQWKTLLETCEDDPAPLDTGEDSGGTITVTIIQRTLNLTPRDGETEEQAAERALRLFARYIKPGDQAILKIQRVEE